MVLFAEMTAVHVQTASKLYNISGVGYGPSGTMTQAVPTAAPAGDSQDPKKAAVAAATAAMAAARPAAATPAESMVQQPLSEAELGALRVLLEGAVLCNDSVLNTVQDEATGRCTIAVPACTFLACAHLAATNVACAPPSETARQPAVQCSIMVNTQWSTSRIQCPVWFR